jgi:hypothetical protein
MTTASKLLIHLAARAANGSADTGLTLRDSLAALGHFRRPHFQGLGGQAGRVLGDPG